MMIICLRPGITDVGPTLHSCQASSSSWQHLVLRVDGNPLLSNDSREWIPNILHCRPHCTLILGFSDCGLSASERGGIADWRYNHPNKSAITLFL